MTKPSKEKSTATPEAVQADSLKLTRFIHIYCEAHHKDRPRKVFSFDYNRLPAVIHNGPELCEECSRLLRHAIVMRALCPLDPKPKCRNCPQHCYRPEHRAAMERVMKYSGPRYLFRKR
ncbi:MAG: nitrous oxide-stimulated promoter family protein [Proteobacteria bacterium]|nr:nitrous oxide-stimulated promoter family protein [Pseudomonadota bacterium]